MTQTGHFLIEWKTPPQQWQGAIRKHSQNYDKCPVNGKIKNAMQEVV